jgi:DNA-binding response OmpR family regulator
LLPVSSNSSCLALQAQRQGLEIPVITCYNRSVGEILLIAPDWQFRALVRAQLIEEGYAVKALPSLEVALADLACGSARPRLAILDVSGLAIDAGALTDLWRLTGEASFILCGGILSRAALDRENLPPKAQVLLRPLRVGDLVKEVRKVLAWAEDETAAGRGPSE